MKMLPRIILAATMCFPLTGCESAGAEPAEEPVCGGVRDISNRSAPKTIESKEIIAFSMSFWLCDRDSDKGKRWTIQATKDNAGRLIVEDAGGAQLQTAVRLLDEVQEIIERFELVKYNGIDRVVSGLPPAFSPGSLSVKYASGEHLYFQMNGNPDAEWPRALLEPFLKIDDKE